MAKNKGGLSPKMKGNRFERKLVALCDYFGIKAERMWGSSGLSRGLPAEVDVIIKGKNEDIRVQCKCRKKMPKFLGITDVVDIVAIKEDRGDMYFIIRAEDYLTDYKRIIDGK